MSAIECPLSATFPYIVQGTKHDVRSPSIKRGVRSIQRGVPSTQDDGRRDRVFGNGKDRQSPLPEFVVTGGATWRHPILEQARRRGLFVVARQRAPLCCSWPDEKEPDG